MVPEKGSNLAWGGDDWRTLFVTSGALRLPGHDDNAGHPTLVAAGMIGPTLDSLGPRFDDALDGPAWDGGGLLFCSVRRSEIHRWDAGSGAVSLVREATVRTRGLAFAPDGRLYGAQSRARRVMWFSDDGGAYYLNSMLDGERHNDPHDLVVDRAGRIWFSDRYTDESIPGPVGYPPLDHHSVLRLTEHTRPAEQSPGDWSLERMTFDTTSPSGLALSPDERTLYVADGTGERSDPSALKAYDIDGSGVLGPPTVLHEFPVGDQARGMCGNKRGGIVICVAAAPGDAAGRVEFIQPSGDVIESRDLPDRPTNCCFGGTTLFVTTEGGQLYSAAELEPE